MRIITDSAADLTAEDIAANDLTVAPLYIQLPEGERRSEELTPDEFYNRLEAMRPEIPTTNMPSPEDFAELYRANSEAGQETLSIHISSGLSGTVQAARIGASLAGGKDVHVVDSLTLSGGLRFQVLAAARAVQAGWPAAAIVDQLERIRTATETIFTLETLEYLARGGRIGRVQALAGSILNIKPVILVSHKDGKYNNAGRSRTVNRALTDIVAFLKKRYTQDGPLWVSVMHGRFEGPAHTLEQMIRDTLPTARLEVLRVSPVLGVHTGPGVVGTAVVPMKYIEEIG